MKRLFITLFFLPPFFSQIVLADWTQLPAVEVNQNVLGGDILLINMKEHLLISGIESAALIKELGLHAKNALTRDIVMTMSIDELVDTYQPSEARPVTGQIINRYSEIILKLNKTQNLN